WSVAEPPGRSPGRLRSRLPVGAPVALGAGHGRGGRSGRLVLGVCTPRGVRAVLTTGAARAALPGGLLLLGLPAAPADPAALRGGDRRPSLADAGEAGPHPGHHDGVAAVQLSPAGAAASARCLAERPALPHLSARRPAGRWATGWLAPPHRGGDTRGDERSGRGGEPSAQAGLAGSHGARVRPAGYRPKH